MRISILRSELDRKPSTLELSWDELKERLGSFRKTDCTHAAGAKCPQRMGPAWSPAVYDGTGRSANAVIGMDCVAFDLDHLTSAQLEEIIPNLEPYSCIIHSTHSHDPDRDDTCLRVVLQISRPLTPEEIKPARLAVIEKLNLKYVDASTSDVGRIYFLPSCPVSGPTPWFTAQDGQTIDVDSLELASRSVRSRSSPGPVLEGSGPGAASLSPIELDPIRKQLLRVSNPESRELMRRVVRGERLAESGNRSNTINKACGVAAFAAIDSPPEALLELMRESINAMEPPETGSWFDVARDSMRRAMIRREAAKKQNRAESAAVSAVFREDDAAADDGKDEDQPSSQADADSEPAEKFSAVQIGTWAAAQNTSPEMFIKRWIIQHGGGYWIFARGKYATVLGREDAEISIFRDLSRAPIELYDMDKSGNSRPKSLRSVVLEYGTVARKVRSSLVLQESFYDAAEQTFHEAVRPLRKLRPAYDAEVQTYFELFGGKQKDTFLDWCALLPNLDQQLCALYMMGEKNTGKSIFAQGAARLWNEDGPSTLVDALKPFNDTLTRNPFCFADEKLPQSDTIIDDLREFIGNKNRALNRKFLNTTGLEGCVRLFIAANNDTLLKDANPNVTQSDVEALAQRILFIDHGSGPTEFLENLRITRGPQYVDTFRSKDRISRHILWLAENRKVENKSRFGVDGLQGDFHEQMITDPESNSNVLEFIVRYICDPLNAKHPDSHLIVGDGRLLVSTEFCASKDRWERYIVSRRTPTAKMASDALKALSENDPVLVGDQLFFSLKIGQVLRWSKRRQVGNIPTLERRIKGPPLCAP